MAFYPDAQPVMGAYHHGPEAGFGMGLYPHHDPQQSLPVPTANIPTVYPFVDAAGQTHIYHSHSYAHGSAPPGHADHGVWQAPQAPRLSAAAARAGRQPTWGYAVPAYAPAHAATAWYAQALALPHPSQQPRTHQQLEHQLLVQHHMAKAHERQNGAPLYPSAFAQNGYQGHHHQHPSQYSHPHHSHHYPHDPHHSRLPSNQYQQRYPHHAHGADGSAAHDRYADRRQRDSWNSDAYHRDGRASDYAGRDWSDWHNSASSHRGSVPHLPHPGQAYGDHAYGPAVHRNSDDASLGAQHAWTAHHDAHGAASAHGWDRAPHYARYASNVAHEAYHRSDASTRDYPSLEGPGHRFYPSQPFDREERPRDAYAASRSGDAHAWQPSMREESQHFAPDETRGHGEERRWPEPTRQTHDVAAPIAAADPEGVPAEGAPDAAAGPPPSSPDSLDKSALPIAAIGAQLIWNACTALFDPDLLAEAHETSDEAMDEDDEEVMSPEAESMPSSSSTPSLNTPDMSPWSSTVLDRPAQAPSSGDWNAFRSPFGPDRMPQLRPQAHSFTFGSDAASSHDDLHRMAVGAERARSALAKEAASTKRSRQGSGHSDALTRHSSGASTASSSEPGTPASLVLESPALSSTISAHSVETARSPLHMGLGMSLDRSRSESAIRSRRSSSKASTKAPCSKWSGRMRDNVVAVLRLVSPDWRWSNNDHLFVSLSESLSAASAEAASSRSPNSQSHGRPGRDSVASIVTSYANEPSPAFRRFVHQVLAQTLLSPTAFLLGILNALRLLIMAQLPDGSIDPVVLGLFAQPTSAAPFKLFTLGMMIANKHLDDNTFLNKTWNEVTGIPLAELNQTEAWFLKKCNYEVTVPDETWIGFLHRLQTWEEKRSSRGKHRDHESSQRLLLVLDEALGYFDAIPALRLDGDITLDAETPHKARAASPVDMWAKSHHRTASLAVLEGGEQHCRSAPAAATHASQRSQAQEQGLARASHLSRASLAMENPSALLMRSSSDYLGTGGAFKEMDGVDGESGKLANGTMSGPLMPSALLAGSRSLFQHSGVFGALSTSGWAHH
ncbi:uncharacterized protein PSANT_05000 [Moesziomyces antarcticus]|nr:uncharacterized protein PSANT_05000 [Moesziomyces antarcticus]